MPSYLCESMLGAVSEADGDVQYYEVGYDLDIPDGNWVDGIQPGDLVVLIDYFGFATSSAIAARVKARGAWILADACQSLLSQNEHVDSDFILFSPRKFVGVPDGGILRCNTHSILDVALEQSPVRWWKKALEASIQRREFDRHGGSRRWFDIRREADSEHPVGPYAMSQLSERLLRFGFDYCRIASRRVENYGSLLTSLADLALFPNLPSGAVPLGFPIRVARRDEIRQVLFEHSIYPPVHWPIGDIIPNRFADSHRLASEILMLPCDQRYTPRHMTYIAEVVLGAV
ncbi:MAG: DegT/DnrJ/EryC1/StrS aminotransferase family protein [Gemmatimonadaceae bacterium]|nr:DegT/DnrJ/EryC1/StrS aminotransferase family protein [Gemmatimonadaceae bacterium]